MNAPTSSATAPQLAGTRLLPASGQPDLLFIYLHGVGARGDDLEPLAEAIGQRYPQAAHLLAEGFEPFDQAPFGRQWFSLLGISEENRPARIAAVIPRLIAAIEATRAEFGLSSQRVCLVGFSQGAILALEAAQAAHDSLGHELAGRVLAFAGRYGTLPTAAPNDTVIHLFHGMADQVVPAHHSVTAAEHLVALGADVTADVLPKIGHEIPAALLDKAVERLQTFVPRKVWEQAMREVAAAEDQQPH